MNIVTTANSSFFNCLQELAGSVKRYYNKQLIVYDVGLSDEQRKSLDATVISIDVEVDFQKYADSSKGPFIKATHKPFCVKHYLDNHCEPMIFVDADCLFVHRVEEHGFDVGVTLRSPERLDLSDHYSGVLNTGVIFFNSNASQLADRWINECCQNNTTDQKALTDILSETIDWQHYNKIYDWQGLKIKVFPTDEYNDFYFNEGKIFHFKGRRHEEGIYEQLLKGLRKNENIYEMFQELTGKQKKGWRRLLTKCLPGLR